jgi:hypothetical protein
MDLRDTKGFAPALAGTKRSRILSAVAAEAAADRAVAAATTSLPATEAPAGKAPHNIRFPVTLAKKQSSASRSVVLKAVGKIKSPLLAAKLPVPFGATAHGARVVAIPVTMKKPTAPRMDLDDGAEFVYASGGLGPSGPWMKWGPASGR